MAGHISRDSTEIEAREKPVPAPSVAAPVKEIRKRGRPRKGEHPPPPEPARLERQTKMTLEEMIDELPKACNVGAKKNSKGYKESWIGYKLHLDVADGQIPISCILTSASLHDSQAAIPLALATAQRVTSLYDLSDSACDAPLIHEQIRSLGHIPIIDINPRRDQALKEELQAEAQRQKLLNFTCAEDVRYRDRTTVERVNGRLKDEFGGRTVKVRGQGNVPSYVRHRCAGGGSDSATGQVGANAATEILKISSCPQAIVAACQKSGYLPPIRLLFTGYRSQCPARVENLHPHLRVGGFCKRLTRLCPQLGCPSRRRSPREFGHRGLIRLCHAIRRICLRSWCCRRCPSLSLKCAEYLSASGTSRRWKL